MRLDDCPSRWKYARSTFISAARSLLRATVVVHGLIGVLVWLGIWCFTPLTSGWSAVIPVALLTLYYLLDANFRQFSMICAENRRLRSSSDSWNRWSSIERDCNAFLEQLRQIEVALDDSNFEDSHGILGRFRRVEAAIVSRMRSTPWTCDFEKAYSRSIRSNMSIKGELLDFVRRYSHHLAECASTAKSKAIEAYPHEQDNCEQG